jgi:uncharacterized membrane protein YfcA
VPTLSTHAVLILVGAGLIGGAGNAVAGGGSLATFPVLIGLGLPPIIANVTNTLGHVPGYVAIVAGLREELTGQQRRVALLTPLAAAGAALGAVLLSLTPPNGFRIAAPFLVLFACALIAVRPRLVGHLTARQGRSARGRWRSPASSRAAPTPAISGQERGSSPWLPCRWSSPTTCRPSTP